MSATKVGPAADLPPAGRSRGSRYVADDTNQEWVSDGTEWIETTGGGGDVVKQSVMAYNAATYPPTNAIDVADGAFTDLLAASGVLSTSITNPSDDDAMIVVASLSLPNLNLSSRDAGGAPTSKAVDAMRIAVLTHVQSGGDATEGDSIAIPDGVSAAIMGPLPITLTRTIGPGLTATFTVTDWLTSVNFDTGQSDHVRVGTQEQGSQAQARLVLQGQVV